MQAGVQASGDFFPEPSVPGQLNAALTGIPADAGAGVITARITAALSGDAVPAGAAAAAVQRVLTPASGWRDHDWRFIREEP